VSIKRGIYRVNYEFRLRFIGKINSFYKKYYGVEWKIIGNLKIIIISLIKRINKYNIKRLWFWKIEEFILKIRSIRNWNLVA